MGCDLEIRGECGSRRFQDISVYIYFIYVFDNKKEVRCCCCRREVRAGGGGVGCWYVSNICVERLFLFSIYDCKCLVYMKLCTCVVSL